MTLRVIICLLTAGLFFAGTVDARFVDKRIRKGGFGIKAGLVSQTTLSVNHQDYTSAFSLSGGVFFEFPLVEHLMLGLSGDLSNVVIDQLKDNEPFFDISIGPKYVTVLQPANIAIKPGLAIGFGYLGPMGRIRYGSLGVKSYRVDRTTYMTWRVSTELLFLTRMQHAYLAELAVFGTAYGGNVDVDVTTNPVFLIRLGVMY